MPVLPNTIEVGFISRRTNSSSQGKQFSKFWFLDGRDFPWPYFTLSLPSIFYCSYTGLPIPRLGKLCHRNGPHHKTNPKKGDAKNQFIEPRIKPLDSLFSTAGSCLDRTLCFFVLVLVHCQSHARLSILRLGECLFRNFYTSSINLIDCEGHISRPTLRTSGNN